MNILLNNYLKKDLVLLEDFTTYPESWKNFLFSNKLFFKLYRSIETKNFNKYESKKQNGGYADRFLLCNKYQNTYDELFEDFQELIKNTEFSILGYHATRLTKEEIDRIKENGLSCFDKNTIKDKINNLYLDGYIDELEKNSLLNNNLLNFEEDRGNKIFFASGKVDCSYKLYNKSHLYNLLNNYGGEIIYNKFEHSATGLKLKSHSFPSIVIFSINKNCLSKLDFYNIAEQIFNQYPKVNKITTSFYLANQSIKIMDVLIVDSKTKVIFNK